VQKFTDDTSREKDSVCSGHDLPFRQGIVDLILGDIALIDYPRQIAGLRFVFRQQSPRRGSFTGACVSGERHSGSRGGRSRIVGPRG
jgi:hypothetical protein